MRRTLREPRPLLKHLPEQGHEAGKPQTIFQQSQAKNRRDGRKRFSGRGDKNLSDIVVPFSLNVNVII